MTYNLDGLNPSNTFELKLLELLASGAPIPVSVTGETTSIPPEVLEAISIMADKIHALSTELSELKSRVDVHTENFNALLHLAGEEKP